MKTVLKIALFLLFLILTPLLHPTYAQDNATEDIKFKYLTIEDGLPDNFVASILQDQQGFLWFGTKNGLVKYDGAEFITYTYDPDNANSLSYNFVWSLLEDKDGNIWIGTLGGGINKFDPRTQTFTRYQHDESNPNSLSHNFVWSIYQDSNGILWIATDGGGLNKFDPDSETFVRYQHDEGKPNSLSHNSVTSIVEDNNGMLWSGTFGGGLHKFDPATETFSHFSHEKTDPLSSGYKFIRVLLYDDESETVWVGTEKGGLAKFDPATETAVHYQYDEADPNSLSNNIVRSIYKDSNGALWVGTHGGLNKLDPQTETFTRYQDDPLTPNSLSDNTVFYMTEDNTQTLWVGTFNGISKYDPGSERFTNYQHNPQNPNGLNDDQILAIYVDDEDTIWLGTKGGGLNKFDRANNTFTHYQQDDANPNSLSDNNVGAILPDGKGALWVGTHGAGFNKFDPANETAIRYQHDPQNPNSLSNNAVLDLGVGPDGTVWLGTLGGGLNKFDPATQTFTHYMHDPNDPNSLVANWIRAVEVDDTGVVWVGAEGGVSRFDPAQQTFTNYQPNSNDPNSLSSGSVYAVYADDNGTIWVGTSDGLNKLNETTQTFTIYRKKQGLADNTVNGVLQDDEGDLWISTNHGLSKFETPTETFRNYDKADGLQSNLFLWHSAFKSKTGELFFGGVNGFNAFFPPHLTDNPHLPPVILTDFQLFNQPVAIGRDAPLQQHINVTDQITLSHDQSVFNFKFAALNYRSPEKNKYAYILEGVDKDWVYVNSNQRFAAYTNLDPGTYTFRVKATNNDGLWNDGTAITITVQPPWWGTWWFRGVILALVIGLMVAAYYWRVHVVEQRNRNLEQEVSTRTKDLQESEARFRGLSESTFEGIVIHDKGIIIDANQAALELFGYTQTALIGSHIRLLATPETWPIVEENVQTGYEQPYEVNGLRCDGTMFPMEICAKVVPYKGKQVRVSAVHNITQRKESEEKLREAKEKAETANKAKSTFLANISHELRTPLNGILGYAQILQRDPSLSPDQKKKAGIVEESGKHLLMLINDVLDLARVEADKITLEPQEFNLPQFVLSVCEMMRNGAEAKQLVCAHKINRLPLVALGDERRLRQVLVNLLGNAIKFTQKGTITLRVEPVTDNNGYIRFQVEDMGIGIAPEKLETIFNPFEQVGDHLRQDEGTGLGLAISRELVALMGGTLHVSSELGRGSVFWFDIPLAAGPGQLQPIPSFDLPITGIKDKTPKILVVDDNAENRQVIVDMLSPLGFVVAEAHNGEAGLTQLTTIKPDAVILDLIMPNMDGVEFIQQVRQLPNFSQTPIIVSSATAHKEKLAQSLAAGTDAFVPKPVNINELLDLLARLLELTWQYETDVEGEPATSSAAPSLTPPPPAIIINSLLEAARMGDIMALQEQARQLPTQNPAWQPFAAELMRLTDTFQVGNIYRWLETFDHASTDPPDNE